MTKQKPLTDRDVDQLEKAFRNDVCDCFAIGYRPVIADQMNNAERLPGKQVRPALLHHDDLFAQRHGGRRDRLELPGNCLDRARRAGTIRLPGSTALDPLRRCPLAILGLLR